MGEDGVADELIDGAAGGADDFFAVGVPFSDGAGDVFGGEGFGEFGEAFDIGDEDDGGDGFDECDGAHFVESGCGDGGVGEAVLVEAELEVGDADGVAPAQPVAGDDASAVDRGAVERAEIVEPEGIVLEADHGVLAGDAGVVELDFAGGGATQFGDVVELVDLA